MRRSALLVICFPLLFIACREQNTLFEKIDSARSGIDFNNRIVENDTINPTDVVNVYNGGGVGMGDFNNDGLQDIFFTGNMVPCKLYLNKGEFSFDDITEEAGVEGMGRWARGVSVVDINNDGWQDIYISNTIYRDSLRRRNILYINKGVKNGVPRFEDKASEYGLDMHVQSTMGNFFDYDNDGDLDFFLTVNEATGEINPSAFGKNTQAKKDRGTGRLYKNEFSPRFNHPVFVDVSAQAGVTLDGYGHGATVTDINKDGWKDIYISNDFISNNILYINNRDGTFTDRSKEYFKHTSFNSMGQDIIDINNDGLEDVFELDMNPEDNYRKKMMLNANNYVTFQNFEWYGYQYQYIRNTLQLNLGPRILEGDTIGSPAFSDISFMSGVAQTDWSWTPLITDFNNDGFRDIVVTNGFPKDVTDHDFIAYRKEVKNAASKSELLQKIPEVKLHNYAFMNKGDLTFRNATVDWGLTTPSFSNGAAYADLDNDGDLDMVVNNINDKAFVYRNTTRSRNDSASHYLIVSFEGDSKNRDGIGAWVAVHYNGQLQVYENTPYRGYLSSNQNAAHFGLGKVALLDSVVVKWRNNLTQVLYHVKADQLLKVKMADAKVSEEEKTPLLSAHSLFTEVTKVLGINYKHFDNDFVDFNIQTTLPHKLSEYSPALASGDINGDGLDDLVMGGNSQYPAQVFFQAPKGGFVRKPLLNDDVGKHNYSDAGLLLFDVNGDGSLDLYTASGGYKDPAGSSGYGDHLYLNDGKGNLTPVTGALPQNVTSKLCVRAFDYNKDGKLDLFVSGRVEPHNYPKAVSSFIYRNDSERGKAMFTDVTAAVAPELKSIGMVCDALFSDFDNDGAPDLILTGEWMPVTFLKNVNGQFKNVTSTSGIADTFGWWNSITAGDFRHTGRMDYIIGNVGLNSLYKASDQYPVFITANDFDRKGGYEAIPSLYLPDKDGEMKEFPAHGRDDVLDKLPILKKKFNDYNSFATSTMDRLFTGEQMNGALRLKVNNSQSCFVRNEGNGRFTLIPLPAMAQTSMLNSMVTDDFDGDGHLDVLISGNDHGTEVSVGRYDALNGLLLKGDGKGGFSPLSILQSGIYIPGNGKALVKLRSATGDYLVAASQNRDALKVFRLKKKPLFLPVRADEQYAIIRSSNGTVRKEELYYGSSFLSQSSRFIALPENVTSVELTNSKGQKRTVAF